MKMWKRFVVLSLTMLLLATAVAPAVAATEVALEIRNKTQTTVQLVLSGPTDMKVTITRAFTVLRVEPGVYTYRYEACGLRNTGTFTVSSTGSTFTLRKCEKDLNGIIVIQNLTGKTFTLILSGPKRIVLTIKPGDNKLTVMAGRFQYSALICGKTQTGTHPIKSGNKNPDWVFRCS